MPTHHGVLSSILCSFLIIKRNRHVGYCQWSSHRFSDCSVSECMQSSDRCIKPCFSKLKYLLFNANVLKIRILKCTSCIYRCWIWRIISHPHILTEIKITPYLCWDRLHLEDWVGSDRKIDSWKMIESPVGNQRATGEIWKSMSQKSQSSLNSQSDIDLITHRSS